MIVDDEQQPPGPADTQAPAARAAHARRSKSVSPGRQRAIALAVLLAGLTLTYLISRSTREEADRAVQARFDIAASEAALHVERRFAAYVEVLSGTRALFNTGKVSREDFRRYADALDLRRTFPGYQALNYAAYVDGVSRDAFESAQRRELALTLREPFAITPPGARDAYYPMTMIEPLAGNEKLLGKDISVVPGVRPALELARDTGRLTSSGRLVNGAKGQTGLAMRLPVYRPGMPLETPQDRRAAYVGSVGAAFSVNKMMARLPGLDSGLRLRLFDGGPEPKEDADSAPDKLVADNKLLFDSAEEALGDAPMAPSPDLDTSLRRVDAFRLGGRQWLVEVTTPRSAAAMGRLEQTLPPIIFAGGAVISVLLAGVLLSLMGSQGRAQTLAHSMTRSLRRSEQRLAEAQGLAKLGSWMFDPRTAQIECSEEARRIYGFASNNEPLGITHLLERVPPAQRMVLEDAVRRAVRLDVSVELEHAVFAADGVERWVHVNLRRSAEGDAVTVAATVRDDTARRRSALRLEVAHSIARELAGQDDPDLAVDRVLSSIGAQSGWHAAVCWQLDADGTVHCLRAWAEGDSDDSQAFVAAMRGWRGPRGGAPLDALWSSTSPLWRTIPTDNSAHPLDVIAARSGLQAALAVPVNAGETRAALEFFSRKPIGMDRDVEGFMRSIASQLAQYLQRKQVERNLRHVANHDALTGLAGRPLLQERMTLAIQRATRHRRRFAVLFMDLDRFKHVNDSLGHTAGDALLMQCADRLRQYVRAGDTVARFGGDEFVVVLEDLQEVADVIAPLTKILNHLSAPFEVQGRELISTVSVGVSVFPDDGHDAETLLMNADAAMYRAKEKGSGTYHFYSAQMNEQGQERLILETGLHRALEREELFLVYQPKLELTTGRIAGVEALMRWRHPTLGLVPPAQFIPIAEDTGLIDSMGRWALEVACRDARRWLDEGHPVKVSVNLSPRQLNRAELAQEVAQVLAGAGLSAEYLEIEITESGVMRNPTRAAAQLLELRALGVSLAIDDFGTGYSSLSYLRRFPLDTLKIDRSFIKDLPEDEDAAGLTAGIVALAHRLRMTVVAEGVETVEQLGFLRTQRCDQIQGFYLSKPITADDMSRFLERDVRNFVGPIVAA